MLVDFFKKIKAFFFGQNKKEENNNQLPKNRSKAETMEKKYKFKELKVYASDEWMANSTKKYRTVFDKGETTYIWAEFSFYNKLFDEEPWEGTVHLKAFDITNGQRVELCNLDCKINVKTDENVVYIRDGWGNPNKGAYWKKGIFLWEAYIDNELIGSQKFYVEDVGVVTTDNNPYFTVESIKLYAGDGQAFNQSSKVYLKKFSRQATQYLWVEFQFKNQTNLDWNYEIFFNFYDDAGQAKGQVIGNGYVEASKVGTVFTLDRGWGTDTGGSWKDEKYTLEIVFMDTLIAVIPYEVGDTAEEGTIQPLSSLTGTPLKMGVQQGEPENLEETLKKLDELIGLEDIKKDIRDHINYLNFIKIRQEKGFEDAGKINLHSVFTGNPGTGKTTVVKMLGKIYKHMGLLSQGHVHEVDRADLVGEYIGQTAPRVKKAIDAARGGILFIDEAYSLARSGEDSKDFGREVIEILLKEMSDGPGDLAVMVAGYPNEMNSFIESNPGLKSRFNNYFHFEDYTPEELLKIADLAAQKRSVNFTPEAREYLEEMLIESYRTRDKSFGNARLVYSVVDEAKMNLGLRLINNPDVKNLSNEELSTIQLDDVKKVFLEKGKKKADIKINEKNLRESIEELNSLIGMTNIKNEVNELVKLVRFYRESGKEVLNKFSLHNVFIGNPGTGKTTVARIIAKIYKGLGLLEKGHIVETARQDLVAAYVGQTGIKTQAKIDESKGGVLFIDEAYALSEGNDSFGQEAIEVILKKMEDARGQFGVTVAGYPDNMARFLEANPGLKSRFDRTFVFADYTAEELYVIALAMLSKEKLKPDAEAEAHLKAYLNEMYITRDKYFGNARAVRKVIEQAIKSQHLRLASMPAEERTKEKMETLTYDDVKQFVMENATGNRMGFKYST